MPPLKVLIGVTGSVATIKLSELLEALRSRNVEVKVIATKGALPFLPADRGALLDEDEWGHWHQIGDPILHIEVNGFITISVAQMGRSLDNSSPLRPHNGQISKWSL